MEALNQEERSSALARFIVFFIITILLTITAVFFDVLTNKKVKDQDRIEALHMRSVKHDLEKLKTDIDSVHKYTQRIKVANPEVEWTKASNLASKLGDKGDPLVQIVAKSISDDYLLLASTLKQISAEDKDKAELIEKLKKDLVTKENELTQCKQLNEILKAK